MSSQNHNDRLLDLLYGELSPSEAEELRLAIDEDEELANSWQELQQAHQEVQAHLPPPENVPTSAQDAIMAAAREHHSDGAPRRRAPVNPGKKGLWGSMVTAGTLQSGLGVAVVLIGCAFVINFLYSQTAMFEDAAEEVSQIDISHQSAAYPAPSGTAYAEATPAIEEVVEEEAEEAAEGEIAQGLIGGIEEAEEAQSQQPASPASDLGAMARLEERQESTRSRAPARRSRAPEPSSAPEPSAAPESNEYGGLGLSGAGRGGGGIGSSAPAPRQRRAAPRPQPQVEAEAEPQESPSLFDEPVQRRTQDRSAPSQDDVAVDAVEEEEEQAEQEAEDTDAEGSLVAQAEQAIEDDEWDRASNLLDAALDDESLSDDDRERVHSLRRRAVRRQSIDAYDASERPDSIESEPADFEPADVFTR